jgi:hypothetical protein
MTSYEEGNQQFLSLKSSVVTVFTVKRNIKKLHFVYLVCRIYVLRMLFTINRNPPTLPMQHQPTGLSLLETHFLCEKGNEHLRGSIAILIVVCTWFITFLANVSSVYVTIY